MANVIREERFWCRRGTAADWASVNPTLGPAEIGVETDTGRMKLGDATTPWNSLDYFGPFEDDAPSDGNEYVRKDGAWTISTGGTAATSNLFTENFYRGIATSTNTGTSFVANEWRPVAYTNGTGATATLDAPGVLMKTGSAVNGLVNLFTTAGLRVKPGREIQRYGCRVALPVLSDGTHSFIFHFGLRTVITGTENEKMLASYTHSSNGGNWTLHTTSGGTTTTTNASVGPVADTETEIELEINQAGTEVKLYVDGALATTNTTNVPTTAMGVACLLFKTLGATERTARVVRAWRR